MCNGQRKTFQGEKKKYPVEIESVSQAYLSHRSNLCYQCLLHPSRDFYVYIPVYIHIFRQSITYCPFPPKAYHTLCSYHPVVLTFSPLTFYFGDI